MIDLVVERDIPEEEDSEEDEDGSKEGKDDKDEKKNKGSDGGGNKTPERKNSKDNIVSDVKPEKKLSFDQTNQRARKYSLDPSKKNGTSLADIVEPKSEEDENLVDLFIDLSVADSACWSIYGSDESLPQQKVSMMPGYFDPNKIVIEEQPIDTKVNYHNSNSH